MSVTRSYAAEVVGGMEEPDPGAWTARYRAVRDLTEALAAPLSAEDQTVQSMPDASPAKWHRAHTTWFFDEFVLTPHHAGHRAFDPAYRFLFNSYYEAVGPRHPRAARGVVSRPGVEEVGAFRAHVDEAMVELLGAGPSPEVLELVELGINHEQQHQELLLMDIKHALSCNRIDPVYRAARQPECPAPDLRWIAHPGGKTAIGHDGGGFAYDNEGPAHHVWLEPFELASRAITNAEVLAFIADDGYRRSDLWLSDGWATVQAEGWEAPLYWRAEDGGWSAFTLAGRLAVDPHQPACHLSYYEADAIARWLGARLPTEAEWEAVAAATAPTGNLLDLDLLHPLPAAAGGAGPSQLFGDVWEWTGSAYLPYPGFRPAPGAVGEYNGKFMVNQQVLRGGACVTPPGHVRATYRNFFPPSARWAFSGARLARSVDA
jgi:ergothioneine biosynthesis protein EgtB